MKQKTVLIVNWLGVYGGAEQYVMHVMQGFDPGQYRFVVACPPGEFVDRLHAAGYTHYPVPLRPGFDVSSVITLARICRREHVDIIHAQQSRGLLQAGVAGRLVGVRALVQTEHNISLGWYERSTYPWYVRTINNPVRRQIVLHMASRIFCFSHGSYDFYTRVLGIPVGKLAIIPSPYPVRPLRTMRPGPLRILGGAGVLFERKGFPVLVDAAALLAKDYPDLDVRIVGEGEQRPGLEAQIERLGLASTVHLLGFQPDAASIMPQWDIFVLSSLWDPFPQVVLEAMANGMPIVATAVDGVREMLCDGETGLLVPPGDAAALAAAIRRLLDDPALAARLGAAARQRLAQEYSIERVAGLIRKVYEDVCP